MIFLQHIAKLFISRGNRLAMKQDLPAFGSQKTEDQREQSRFANGHTAESTA